MSKLFTWKTRYSFRILTKLEFSRQIFEKKAQISSLIKIRPVRPELFYADGRMDIRKLIVAFRNFANAPKNYEVSHSLTSMNLLLQFLAPR